jgi:hypothetical protein
LQTSKALRKPAGAKKRTQAKKQQKTQQQQAEVPVEQQSSRSSKEKAQASHGWGLLLHCRTIQLLLLPLLLEVCHPFLDPTRQQQQQQLVVLLH